MIGKAASTFILFSISIILGHGASAIAPATLSVSPPNQTVGAGNNASFTCLYQRVVKKEEYFLVLWEQNDDLIWLSKTGWSLSHAISASVSKGNQSVTSVLNIRNVIAGSRGRYTCIVVDENVYETAQAHLDVDTGLSSLAVLVGTSVNITCHSRRKLAANEFFIWYFNGRILVVNHTQITLNPRISIQELGMTLVITNTTLADSGTYRCRILHEDVTSFSLVVHEVVLATTTPTQKPGEKKETNWKIYVGIGVGAVFLILVVAGLIFFYCKRS